MSVVAEDMPPRFDFNPRETLGWGGGQIHISPNDPSGPDSAPTPKKIFQKRPTPCSFVRLNTDFHFSGRPGDWDSKLRLLRFRWPTFAVEFSKALLLIDCNRKEMTSRGDGLCAITRRTLMRFNKRPLSTPASPVHKRALPPCASNTFPCTEWDC